MDNSIQNSHAGRILVAAHQGDEAAVAQALAEGADLEARDAWGHAPLMLAVMGGHGRCVRMLVDAGARLDAKSGEGARQAGSGLAQEEADPGSTAAMIAAARGFANCLAPLIEAGANLDARDRHGQSALMMAARNGKEGCLAMLIAGGVDPGAAADRGTTAAMLAARAGHEDVLAMLIAAGADLEARDEGGWGAARWAFFGGSPKLAEFLGAVAAASKERRGLEEACGRAAESARGRGPRV